MTRSSAPRLAAALAALAPSSVLAQATPGGGELEAPVRLKAGEEFIDSGEYIAHSGPLFADVTGDGLPDLLVGNFKGHVQVYENVGTRGEPLFEDKGLLEAEGEQVKVPNW